MYRIPRSIATAKPSQFELRFVKGIIISSMSSLGKMKRKEEKMKDVPVESCGPRRWWRSTKSGTILSKVLEEFSSIPDQNPRFVFTHVAMILFRDGISKDIVVPLKIVTLDVGQRLV